MSRVPPSHRARLAHPTRSLHPEELSPSALIQVSPLPT